MNMLRNMIKRCFVTLAGKDDLEFPVQQVSYNGNVADIEIIFPYGLHANLSANEETLCTMFSVEGQDDYRVAMGHTPRLRPKGLAEGEVALYHPRTQSQIFFRTNGDIDISTEGESGDLNITLKKDLNITVDGDAIIDVAGTTTVNSEGDADITTQGNASLTATGTVDITGSTINLN